MFVEIKRHLLLGRKAMTNLDSVLKSRDICLPTEVIPVKIMVIEQTLGNSEGLGSLACCSPWVANSRTWLRDSTRTKNASDNYLEYLCKNTHILLHKWNSIYFGWGSLDKLYFFSFFFSLLKIYLFFHLFLLVGG